MSKQIKVHGNKPKNHGGIDFIIETKSKVPYIKRNKDKVRLPIVSQKKYKEDISELCDAFDDIIWMATRYAHGRHTYAPSMVRDACKVRNKFNKIRKFVIKRDITLDSPKKYISPCNDDKLETIKSDDFINLSSDDLRDLMKKYKE